MAPLWLYTIFSKLKHHWVRFMSTTEKKKRRREAVPKHFLPVEQRVSNFDEVNLGYLTEEEVYSEADRCLTCGKPKCEDACPAHFDIRDMMVNLKERNPEGAAKIVNDFYCFPSSFNRICPAFCQDACVVGKKGEPIQIVTIKRFLADHNEKTLNPTTPSGKKIAVIGAGPAGLTVAHDLALRGHSITVFEKFQLLGGMLAVGIPEYRLKNSLLESEIRKLESIGVIFKTGVNFGVDIKIDDLFSLGYDAIFIGHGAHKPKYMNIPGEDLEGVVHAIDFLRNVALREITSIGKHVVVIGGGDVAIDAVRVSLRLGSTSEIIYRRTKAEMPAAKEEIEATEEEGIKIEYLRNPTKIIGMDGKVTGIEVIKMELGEPDESGRRRPIPIQGSEYIIPCDTVIEAISQEPEFDYLSEQNFVLSKWHTFEVDPETYMTSVYGVFAAGDDVTGPKTAIEAIAAAKKAAENIDSFVSVEETSMEVPAN